jgi:hypothetical protein
MTMKSNVFWNVMPCCLLKLSRENFCRVIRHQILQDSTFYWPITATNLLDGFAKTSNTALQIIFFILPLLFGALGLKQLIHC